MTNGEILFRSMFGESGVDWNHIGDRLQKQMEDDASRYEALKAEVAAKLNGAEVAK